MNAIEIVFEYLKSNGFDGLRFDDECGCDLANIAHCNRDFSACGPGYKVVSPTGDIFICENKDDKPWEKDMKTVID